jgi:hypothetical protein
MAVTALPKIVYVFFILNITWARILIKIQINTISALTMTFVIYKMTTKDKAKKLRDHPFKTAACLRGGGGSPCADVCRC